MTHWVLLGLPVIGGLIGWLTNYLAVKMIFRPTEPRRILGLELHGLLPKRRRELAAKIAETVEAELINVDDIRAAMEDPEIQARFLQLLEDRFESFVATRLGQLNPMIAAFVSPEMIGQLRSVLLDEVARQVPQLVETMTDHLDEKLDLKQVVIDRIETFETEKLEAIVLRIASKELKHIEHLGGLLGFLIGVAQALLVYYSR